MFQGTGFGTSTSSPFGSSAYKPAVFNTGPMFGSTGSSSLFGSNTTQPSTGIFGSTTTPAFGQTQQPQNTFGGFTTTSNAGTTLFGTQQNANTGGLFGSTTTPFGQNKPAFGGFGTTNQSTGLFGQQTTPTQPNQPIFGQPQAQQSTGLFGASTAFGGGGAGGTTIKFTPVTGTDTMVKNGVSTQISTRHHCITCMKEYESKSLEELRLDDYMANRKGPQQGGQTGGLFGAPPQQPSLFGTQSSTASTGLFGTTDKSVFGTATTGFGAPNTNLFGGNVGSMFNKPAGTATAFGSTPTSSTATTNFGFNTNTSNNLFGQTTQPGFFSNTSQPSSAFGTQSSGFTPFGQNQQQGGLFSQNKPTFNIGSNTNQGFSFGSTATTSSTLTPSFTANKTTPFSTFGTPSTSAGFGQLPFGQAPNQSSSFFSSSFNKPASSGFPFGSTTTTNTLGTGLNFNSSNSIFGQNQNKTGGLFNTGSSNLFNMNNTFSGGSFNTGTSGLNSSTFSLGSNPASNSLLPSFGQNAAAPQNNALNHYMLVLASMPFGDSPLFKNLVPSTSKSDESIKPTSPAAMKYLQSGINHKVLPNTRSKVKIVKPNSVTRNSLFDGLDEDEEELNSSLTSLDGNSVKNHRLNVRSLHLKTKQFTLDTSLNQSYNDNNNSTDVGYNNMTSPQPQDKSFTRLIKKNLVFLPDQLSDNDMIRTSDRGVVSPNSKMNKSAMNNSKIMEISNTSLDSSVIEDPLRRRGDVNLNRLELSKMNISNVNNQSENKEPPEQSTSTSSSGESEAEECGAQSDEPHPTGIVLTRSGYYTIPSLSDLAQLMDSEGRCIVDNFTVGRLNYGNVFYPESFDVANLNLDKIVHFRHKEVVIYPDDEDKPPVGSGLNRRAQVTLDRVWPVDKQTRQPISDPMRLQAMNYEEKLRVASAKHGTRFIEFRPQTGSWVFKVEHFSKYALTDSDEEDGGGGSSVKQAKVPFDVLPGKDQLHPSQQNDAAASAMALQVSHKFRTHKSMIDDQMEVQLDPLSVHLFLEDEDEEMTDDPFDHYEMDNILTSTNKLSRQLGTSAHKLQLMKASFFEPDLPLGEDQIEGEDDLFHPSQQPPVRLSSVHFGEPSSMGDLPLPLRTRHDTTSKADYSKQLLTNDERIDESEEEFIIDNEAASSRPVLYQVDYGSSWLQHSLSAVLRVGQEGYLADQMFARGLSFKASWGPSGVLTTVKTDSPFFVDTLSLTSMDHQSFKDSVVEQLEGALKCSHISVAENGSPLALCPDGVVTLTKHLSIARRQASTPQMFLNAFALCHALWGELPTTDSEDTIYNISLARKHAVSSWLEIVTEPLAKSDVDCQGDSPLSVFALMTCHSIMEACKLAMSIGDKRLSLVLSQAGSSRIVRGLIDRQLTEWRQTQADRLIVPGRIMLYMLSAGKLTHQTSESLVSACETLDWIRAFALHLWYVCWTTSSVSEALKEYDRSWSGKDKYAPSPVPPHVDALDDSDAPSSLLYHLLKLFSDKSHPLDLLLNPNTHTSDPLDYRLSWMLMRVLMSLGYSHLSEYNICLIHSSFASQLELYGLWHWAVFVLLHIDSAQHREKLICDTIERHIIHEKDDAKEKFLKEKLKIPIGWIASTKATKALVNESYEEAARNLLLAGEWNHAHEIIMKYIASTAMVNDKYSLMEELLCELEKEDRFREILNWDSGGLVLLEYLRCIVTIESLRQNGQINEVLFDLTNMAQGIYTRIKLLPNTTPMDRLCQTELSERLLKLLPEVSLDISFAINTSILESE